MRSAFLVANYVIIISDGRKGEEKRLGMKIEPDVMADLSVVFHLFILIYSLQILPQEFFFMNLYQKFMMTEYC